MYYRYMHTHIDQLMFRVHTSSLGPPYIALSAVIYGSKVHIRQNDAIKWKYFPRYWPFVRGIYRLSLISPHKGQWRGALMFSLICAWINRWVNTGEAGDLRRHRAHYDVIVMVSLALNFYQYLRVSVPLCWLQCVFLYIAQNVSISWWRHQMETFSALLAICAGNSPVHGEFPAQRLVTRNFDVYFDMHPNNRLSKQSWCWWFETQSRPLWRHRNVFRLSFSLVPVLCGLCQLSPQRVSHTVCIYGSLYRNT